MKRGIGMTLKQHVIDTIKEWQLKLGASDHSMGLYYPKQSLCQYLKLGDHITDDALVRQVIRYFKENAPELGTVYVQPHQDRFCIEIADEGMHYVETQVAVSDFLRDFLAALKTQQMDAILAVFHEYASHTGERVIQEKEEDGLGTVIFFERGQADPYVYCVNQDVFGITYHRFAKEDFEQL